MFHYFLTFALCVSVIFSQNVFNQQQQQQSCETDIIVAIDGTPYIKNKTYVLEEINFIENMISNWTFGDGGVNVAFMTYGFNGQLSMNEYYDTFADVKAELDIFKSLANNGILNPISLTSMVRFLASAYTSVYLPRPNAQQRVMVFTSSTNSTDITNAEPYFTQLINKKYESIINVIFADSQLYSEIKALKIIDMHEFLPEFYQNITETIYDNLCNACSMHYDGCKLNSVSIEYEKCLKTNVAPFCSLYLPYEIIAPERDWNQTSANCIYHYNNCKLNNDPVKFEDDILIGCANMCICVDNNNCYKFQSPDDFQSVGLYSYCGLDGCFMRAVYFTSEPLINVETLEIIDPNNQFTDPNVWNNYYPITDPIYLKINRISCNGCPVVTSVCSETFSTTTTQTLTSTTTTFTTTSTTRPFRKLNQQQPLTDPF